MRTATHVLRAVVLALALLVVVPTVAAAVEEDSVEAEEVEPRPELSEIGTQAAREGGFFPEEYESPQWFQWLLYPLIVVGVLMAIGILGYYLLRQPDFERERRTSSRR